MEKQKKKTKVHIQSNSFLVRLVCVLIGAIAFTHIAIKGKAIIVPLILGFLIAIILIPVARSVEGRLRFPKIISALLLPILFYLGIIGVFVLFGAQILNFQDDLPEFKRQLLELLHTSQDFLYSRFGISEEEQINFITNNAEKALTSGTSVLSEVAVSVTSGLSVMLFAFLSAFFFLYYRQHFRKFIIWSFPPKRKNKVTKVLNQIQSIIKQYIIGLFIQVVTVTILMYIAYSIIGIKYAFLFALMCGVLNLIPYLGIFTATTLAALVTLVTGTPMDALWVIVAVIVVNSIDGNVIMPLVIGSKVSLNSFAVVFGIVFAESIWGIAGMFLAIPLLAITKIIFDNVPDLRPYGFFLGEENQPTPMFEKYYSMLGIKNGRGNKEVFSSNSSEPQITTDKEENQPEQSSTKKEE